MGNPHRGEVTFEVEGKPYKLCFSANALCEMESALNLGINEISERMSKVEKLRMTTVRAVFWAGLTDNHPDVSIKDAGLLISAISMARVVELIGEAFSLAFPEASGDARPQTPDRKDGIGQVS